MAHAHRRVESLKDADSVKKFSREEGEQLVDRQARKFLNMSGKEFARAYRAGKIENPHRLAVARVAILLPLIEK